MSQGQKRCFSYLPIREGIEKLFSGLWDSKMHQLILAEHNSAPKLSCIGSKYGSTKKENVSSKDLDVCPSKGFFNACLFIYFVSMCVWDRQLFIYGSWLLVIRYKILQARHQGVRWSSSMCNLYSTLEEIFLLESQHFWRQAASSKYYLQIPLWGKVKIHG